MRTVAEHIQLPLPTSATKTGPRITLQDDSLRVEYDFEHPDQAREVARIVFREVLALHYKQASSAAAEDITDSGILIRMSESLWLTDILSKWANYVGWQDYQKRLGGAERFSHFHIYFDDAASVDIVASGFMTG